MKIKIVIVLWLALLSFSAGAQYSFPACWTPWTPNPSGYPGGTQMSHKSGNYQAKWSTIAEPGTTGDWSLISKCGDGGIGPDYTGPQRIIGYLPYWVPDFDFQSWDPGTVTHINIAFNLFKQNNNDFNSTNFASVAWGEFHNRKVDSILFDLGVLNRAKAKNVKVCVAIGGATDFAFLWLMTKYYNNDAKLEEIANFITNYVNTKGIDGVDLDLECWWPDATISGTTEQGGRVRGDKWGGPDQGPHPAGTGLAKLAQKLRQKMPNKVLSAAVFATSYYGNNYDDAIAPHLDYLGLMTYDFTGSWNTSPVGPHSSLYKVPPGTYQGQSDANPIYSAEDALEYWMGMAPAAWNHDGGFNVPKAKLCIGVPFYGYDLATRKPNNANGFVAPKWKEIVASYPNAATSFDPLDSRQLGGYIGADNKKIYYETPKGAAEKIKYTKRFGHQGVIIWEVTGDVPYSSSSSLLKSINDAVGTVINPPPTVSITSPANNASFTAGATVTINATASDNVSVARVEFFQGTTKLGEDTSSPYSFSWTNVAAGNYSLTARATDNQGATTNSSAVTISVTAGNVSPTASITAPANNSTHLPGSTIVITANANDPDGTIAKVEFFQGSTKLGEDASTPYSFNWANVPAGSYALTARATDNLGATGTSSVVNIIVVSEASPTVSITAPANNASFTAPATVTINANASDSDGTISKVDFYNGSTLLGTDTSTPYSFTWSNVAAGSYSLTARATDNSGSTTTSSAVNITVTTTPGLPAPWQTADIGAVAAAGSASHSNGTFTLQGSGADIWGTADEFRFVYQTLNGNGSIVARVTALTNTNAWAKSGVMIRESLTAGSKHASTVITPSNGVSFPRRTATSGTSTSTTIAGQTVPKYVRISRSGSTFTSAYSSDGVNFTTVSTISITMATNVYIGLCLTSHNDGVVANSTMTNVAVTGGSNIAPTASITTPGNGASFNAPASITINAVANDSDGTIAKVDFFNGATLLGTDTSSPYSFTWTNVPNGSYTLTAIATDNAGATGTSSPVNVSVVSVTNNNPTASITSPANGATFTAPASVTINATATDTDGTISKVDFYNGSTLLGTDTSSPYSFTWTNVAAGSYALTARATDNANGTGTSSVVNITVNSVGNSNPTASISSPANGATYTAPASVTISANATDTDGTISKVDFFNGSTLIGTDNTSPYSFTWTNVAAGSYTLTARATDNAGGSGTSSGVSITVSSGSDNCASTPQYVENGGYVAGSLVKNVGSQYECKPHPFTGWCNGAAWAYAPGTGTYWQDAWILKGSCTGGAGARSGSPSETDNTADVNELETLHIDADGLSLSPNPGTSGRDHSIVLTFENAPGQLKLHLKDVNGADVFSHQYNVKGKTLNADLPQLPSGLYILRVRSEKQFWMKKYLVK